MKIYRDGSAGTTGHKGKGYNKRGKHTVMNLKDIQIYIFYTNTQTAHKTHKGKKNVLENQNPAFFVCLSLVCFPPSFSPLPPPVEVQFIPQVIYTNIGSMHKKNRSSHS